MERHDGKLVATTCGVVEHVNKLLYVRPLKHRYSGSVGDVVVGRIVEVQTDRWAVEIGTAQLAYLHLGAIQLPGNVQRRRTTKTLCACGSSSMKMISSQQKCKRSRVWRTGAANSQR